jgi:SAM-dependent methyltransferase
MIQLLKRARGDGLVRLVAQSTDAQLRSIEERLERIEKLLGEGAGAASGLRPSIDRDSWVTAAQEGELAFHKRHNFRAEEKVWRECVKRDWGILGIEPTGWEGKLVVDVGAGSRLRSLYFEGAKVAVLEPLADRYMNEVSWHDLDKADEVYSVPAEELVPQLEGRADFVVSINALDHGYDFARSVRNIRRYVKPDGLVLLGFDMHDEPDEMHPLVLNDEIVRRIYDDAGFRVEKTMEGRRYHGTDGPLANHYWLRPF